jgi:hypothetical protein
MWADTDYCPKAWQRCHSGQWTHSPGGGREVDVFPLGSSYSFYSIPPLSTIVHLLMLTHSTQPRPTCLHLQHPPPTVWMSRFYQLLIGPSQTALLPFRSSSCLPHPEVSDLPRSPESLYHLTFAFFLQLVYKVNGVPNAEKWASLYWTVFSRHQNICKISEWIKDSWR